MGKLKNHLLFCFCATALAFALSYSRPAESNVRAASVLPQTVPFSWQVVPGRQLVPGQGFSLYTSPPGQFVVYGRREYGINLNWARPRQPVDSGAPANFTLSRASGSTEPIKFGEVVALKEKTGGYIYYKPREYGINLEFSGQPAYEWEVRGGANGSTVSARNWGDSGDGISDVRIKLYNRTINCYVVYGQREYGINLVWTGGSRC